MSTLLFKPNGCKIVFCNKNTKFIKYFNFLVNYFKREKPEFRLTLFGTSEFLIRDLSNSGITDISRNDIIHLYKGNPQDTWQELPQHIKNKSNFINSKIPNVGNKNKKGCSGLYLKNRLLRTFNIAITDLGIHKLALVRSSLIPVLYSNGYGGIKNSSSLIKYRWAVDCLKYKLPIFLSNYEINLGFKLTFLYTLDAIDIGYNQLVGGQINTLKDALEIILTCGDCTIDEKLVLIDVANIIFLS